MRAAAFCAHGADGGDTHAGDVGSIRAAADVDGAEGLIAAGFCDAVDMRKELVVRFRFFERRHGRDEFDLRRGAFDEGVITDFLHLFLHIVHLLLFLVAHIELGVAVVRDCIRDGAALDSPYADRETFLINGECLKERELLGHFDDGVLAFEIVVPRVRRDASDRDVAVETALAAYGHAVIEAAALHIEAA